MWYEGTLNHIDKTLQDHGTRCLRYLPISLNFWVVFARILWVFGPSFNCRSEAWHCEFFSCRLDALTEQASQRSCKWQGQCRARIRARRSIFGSIFIWHARILQKCVTKAIENGIDQIWAGKPKPYDTFRTQLKDSKEFTESFVGNQHDTTAK